MFIKRWRFHVRTMWMWLWSCIYDEYKLGFFKSLLPPACEVQREVMFSQMCVCPTFGGVAPSNWLGGVPCARSMQGGTRSPHPADGGGYPIPGPGRGVPHPRSRWGVPHPDDREIPPIQDWMGTSLSRPGMGYPLSRTGWSNPASHQETEQHSEHLLCGGRYASCIHAGDLSCLRNSNTVPTKNEKIWCFPGVCHFV